METLNLARRLDLGPLPPEEAAQVAARVAQIVSGWHSQGLLHRNLNLETIYLGAATEEIEIDDPASEPVDFNSPQWDPEKSPAEFSSAGPISVPREITEARNVFSAARLGIDPTQIDIYQLGALLCRLLTGEGATAYLSNLKTKSRIPAPWRTLLDRALGYNRVNRLQSAAEFAAALMASQMPTQVGGDTAPAENPPSQAEKPNPFARMGDYEIRGRIGHGGMGDVYLGFDERRNRSVAVKVLPEELARQTDFVRRFYAEAAAAARLVHPHIIEILYVGEDQGRHFFVMEYVAGESLAERLARQKYLSIDEAVATTLQILSALQMAHEEGFVHRDIKPSNILLESARRRAVLADFGLVKSLQEATGMTATGVVVGTVHYLSPEQARGRMIDGRSDLYSIGVLLFQMLSGELPFNGEGTTALIYQHVYEPPRPLAEVAPNISPVLGVIVDKLLAKAPADRYANAGLLIEDLKAFAAEKPLPSGADIIETDDEEDRPFDDDAPVDATVIISAPKFEQTPLISLPEPPPEPEELPEPKGWWNRLHQGVWARVREIAPEFAASLQTAEEQLDSSVDDYEARQRNLQQLTKKALRMLQELRQQRNDWQAAAERTGDDEERQRAQQNISELTQQIAEQQEQLSAMRLQQAKVSANLERLRSQRDVLQARMKVVETSLKLSGWKRRRQLAVSLIGACCLLAIVAVIWIAMDGSRAWERVAKLTSAVGVKLHDTTLRQMPLGIPAGKFELPQQKLQGVDGRVTAMEFSADGGKIYLGFSDSRIGLWDLESGKLLRTQTHGKDSVVGMATEPKTDRLISWESYNPAGNIRIWPAGLDGTPEVRHLEDVSQILVGSSLDESLARYTERTPGQTQTIEKLMLINFNSNSALQVVASSTTAMTYDPTSRTAVYVTSDDGALHTWSLESKTETRVIRNFTSPKNSPRMAISPNGHRLAAQHSGYPTPPSIAIWNLDTGNREMEYRIQGKNLVDLAFHPESELLAIASSDQVELWDLKQRKVVKLFQAQSIHRIAFSPDGEKLAAYVGDQQLAVVLWDAAPPVRMTTGNVVTLPGQGPAALSEDGTRYAATAGSELLIREVQTQQEIQRVKLGNGTVKRIVLSPKGHLAVVATETGPTVLHDLKIVDLSAGKIVHTCQGEPSMEFDPAGQSLYYVHNNTLTKYDLESGASTVLVRTRSNRE